MTKHTLILIHGAWHGGWCWDSLLPLLQEQYNLVVPTLPGHDGQTELMTWDGYITQLTDLIVAQPEPVVLLGHSLAGLLITQLANTYPDKISHLIYLAAFIPEPGDSMQSTIGKLPMPVENPAITITDDHKKLVLRSQYVAEYFYHLCSPEWVEQSLPLLCDQNSATFRETINYDPAIVKQVPRDYLICKQDRAVSPNAQQQMALYLDCKLQTLNTDHSPFASRPQQLADAVNRILSVDTQRRATS